MLGIIAWIRPDGRNALVVVSGSNQIAAGDPGRQSSGGLAVGDMVYLEGLSPDMASFDDGLQLVKPGYWPRIVQDIGAIGRSDIALRRPSLANIVSIFPARGRQSDQRPNSPYPLLAAE